MPQQPRGRRRVARLLSAADQVIGEAGYEAATMCAIAARAGSSVGSLYQFFPNKRAVADALRVRYGEEYAEFWRGFTTRAAGLGAELLASEIIDFPLEFAKRHPAFLPLLDAPWQPRKSKWRQTMRSLVAGALRARQPELPRARAMRMAEVVLQIVKGLVTLYAQAGAEERGEIVSEFKVALAAYLRMRLEK